RTLSWTAVEVFWRVKEYDLVKVPAGDFRAFLLESRPSTNWGISREQIWYAPDVKQPIKIHRERTAAHYLGRGKEDWELIQFALKGGGTKGGGASERRHREAALHRGRGLGETPRGLVLHRGHLGRRRRERQRLRLQSGRSP